MAKNIKLVKSLIGRKKDQIATAQSLGLRKVGDVRIGFEGGQMPLARRIPKRGFNNIFASKFAIVNVSDLNKFKDGTIVDAELLKAAGLIKKEYDGVKVLGNGELTAKLTVKAAKFSQSAVEKIEKAGGKTEVM